nr:hypothetical protein [Candidatus Freyarchaeota archaeon]
MVSRNSNKMSPVAMPEGSAGVIAAASDATVPAATNSTAAERGLTKTINNTITHNINLRGNIFLEAAAEA